MGLVHTSWTLCASLITGAILYEVWSQKRINGPLRQWVLPGELWSNPFLKLTVSDAKTSDGPSRLRTSICEVSHPLCNFRQVWPNNAEFLLMEGRFWGLDGIFTECWHLHTEISMDAGEVIMQLGFYCISENMMLGSVRFVSEPQVSGELTTVLNPHCLYVEYLYTRI